MPLKRNDKIIIGLFVAFMIVAAIMIAFYTQPSVQESTPQTSENGGQMYEVSWALKTDSLSEIQGSAVKNSPYEETVMIPHGNLKNITFNLSWVDNRALLGIFGLDTLTLEVTAPDGTIKSDIAKSARRTKAGTIQITFDVTAYEPSTNPIEANNSEDAKQKLMQDPYYNDKWANQEFKITVSVSPGERILWRLRDSGNSFSLNIEYQFYSGTASAVKENINPGDDQLKDTSQQRSFGIFIPTGNFGYC